MRRRTAHAAAALVALLATSVVTSPSAVSKTATTWPLDGSWAFELHVDAWSVADENIGTFDLHGDGSCHIRLRASFGGLTNDQSSTRCAWSTGARSSFIDGSIVAEGITPTPFVLSFVVASAGERLLLLFDDTTPGALGHGEATRR